MNARIHGMDQLFAPDLVLCEAKVQFIVGVEVSEFLAAIDQTRKPVIPSRLHPVFDAERLQTPDQLIA